MINIDKIMRYTKQINFKNIKYISKEVLSFLERIDNKISEYFIFNIESNPVNINKESKKYNHDYIVDYMISNSKEEMDNAIKLIPIEYPFK